MWRMRAATPRHERQEHAADCGTLDSLEALEEAKVRSGMLSSLRLTNFKNFADESIRFGPFTVIVGANATGKSNLRDAIRFLHGIGRNYTLAEIVGGMVGAGGQQVWEPIRGGTSELIRFGCKSFKLELKIRSHADIIEYGIEVGLDDSNPDNLIVLRKRFISNDSLVYDSHPYGDSIQYQNDPLQLSVRLLRVGSQRRGRAVAFSRDTPIATQIHESQDMSALRAHKIPVNCMFNSLNQIKCYELMPDRMRSLGSPRMTALGDHGENLPAVLMDICNNHRTRSFIVDWISEFTSMNVWDIEFLKDPSGMIRLVIRESRDKRVPAYSASSGTLRFLSMLAVLFGQSAGHSYFIEEIDSGMHPSQIQLMLALIQQWTYDRNVQVVATTYSSHLLSVLSDEEFEDASIIARIDASSDAIIRPLSKLHHIHKLRTSQGINRLMTSGWMEDALTFTEDTS